MVITFSIFLFECIHQVGRRVGTTRVSRTARTLIRGYCTRCRSHTHLREGSLAYSIRPSMLCCRFGERTPHESFHRRSMPLPSQLGLPPVMMNPSPPMPTLPGQDPPSSSYESDSSAPHRPPPPKKPRSSNPAKAKPSPRLHRQRPPHPPDGHNLLRNFKPFGTLGNHGRRSNWST